MNRIRHSESYITDRIPRHGGEVLVSILSRAQICEDPTHKAPREASFTLTRQTQRSLLG